MSLNLSNNQQAYLDITGFDYTMSGDDIATQCPFCGETRKKFGMSPQGFWNCFICETSGRSLVSFVAQYNEVSFKEAQEMLSSTDYTVNNQALKDYQANGDLFESVVNLLGNPLKQEVHLRMPKLPTNTFHLVDNMDNPEAFPFFVYLHKRKITLEQIYKYDIRYCIKGVIETSLGKTITIRNSIIFVSHDAQGKPKYWNTRSIELNPYVKALNAPAGENNYSKNNAIWNEQALVHNKTVILNEGIFNALMVEHKGIASVATYGKKITDEQIELILSYHPRSIGLFLDEDAKTEEWQLANRIISKGFNPDKLFIINNPYGNQDANDIGQKKVWGLLKQALPYSDKLQFSNMLHYYLRGKLSGN